MSESTLTRVEFGPADTSLAEREGVNVPEIDVADSLRKELSESGLEVFFDTTSVIKGMSRALVENHVHVIVSADDDVEKTPELDFEDKEHRDTVVLTFNPDVLNDKRASERANVGFWEAVLASNILGQPKTAAEELEQIRDSIKHRSLIAKRGGTILKAVGLACTAMVYLNPKFAVPALIAGTIKGAGSGVKWISERWRSPLEDLHLMSEEFEKQVQKKIGNVARELADSFPVIEFEEIVQ